MNRPALEIVAQALARGEALLLVLSRRRASAAGRIEKVSVRPVVVHQQPMFQFTYHEPDRVTHENLAWPEAADRAVRLLTETYEYAALFTPEADCAIRSRPDGSFRCKMSPPTKSAMASPGHNRTKERLIPEGVACPFLIEIGVMTREGRVRSAMMHKFRQINRFLELVDDVVPALDAGRVLRIVDFGCGKSYLTFALHYLITEIHGREVQIIGLDRKADVITRCASLARRLGCRGLEFCEGDIAGHRETGPVDLAVSLHACDTATDDALVQALRWKSRAILAVPCCQHELARIIENRDLAPLVRHGILRERFAALATDALRALALEICGYTTQVVEFIDLEHTAKNLLIRAVRREQGDAPRQQARLAEYRQLKQVLGIGTPYLERALGPAVFES